jgi:hypothetical protein
MFDFLFNNGVIFIAIAIFIGRLILQLRRRGREEGENPPSRVPRFFEEKEEDDEAEESGRRIAYSQTRGSSDFLRELVMREAAKEAAPRPPPPKPGLWPPPEPGTLAEPEIRPAAFVPPSAKPAGRLPEENPPWGGAAGFPASLNRLSPMRRAVVLAEILGPPKGL